MKSAELKSINQKIVHERRKSLICLPRLKIISVSFRST
ncbi:unnamed protein product [Larinioides sclopetarius]|uniref:Uncharacterized protein n=1 Tax=Larinioides sclopetarius TaxID=280406 RepID=A0AAV2ATK0_9ARAC